METKPTVLVFGGTGYIGSVLARTLDDKKYPVIIVTRKHWLNRQRVEYRNIEYRYWDLNDPQSVSDILPEGNCYIVNLAGESLDRRRWTKRRQELAISSRKKSGEIIINALANYKHKIRAVVSASSVGWYGKNENAKPFEEDAPAANDFLGEICQHWESSISEVQELGIRLVVFRMGVILGRRCGFLQRIRRFLSWGIVPIFGSGNHIISWIHEQDYIDMVLHTLENEQVQGIYNAVAPIPVSQRYLMSAMQKIYYTSSMKVYIPRVLIKLLFGEKSQQVLRSCRVSCKKIQDTGFAFRFPNIEKTLRNILLEI